MHKQGTKIRATVILNRSTNLSSKKNRYYTLILAKKVYVQLSDAVCIRWMNCPLMKCHIYDVRVNANGGRPKENIEESFNVSVNCKRWAVDSI